MKSFFAKSPTPAEAQTEGNEPLKMADAIARQDDEETQSDELVISRQELVEIHKDLHRSLREAVEEIIQPINIQLNNFMAELRDTSKKVDTNTATCTSLQAELYEEKIRFRWSPSSDIIVYKNGTQFIASDTASGKELMKACGLSITLEEEQLLGT
ncbi:UNVERIFIED_CONTAM: hypothetical protein K2H54_001514 [Gekko kuhli]